MKVAILLLFVLVSVINAQTSSGYINVNQKDDANLFYYFQKSQHNPATDPVILWLQGGPGCSSLFGLYVENGPEIIQTDGSFKTNPWSWNLNASVIWIDSPVGTGYSYVGNGDYATDEVTIANDLYTALYTFFFTLHPEYSTNKFYIFGESYAGKYVPWLASTVLDKNINAPKKINLQAIGIGDGWVNPYYQTGSNAPFLYRHNLINTAELDVAVGIYETYKGLVDVGLYDEAMVVGNDLLALLMAEAGVGDPYDIRKSSDPTDPLQDLLGVYLNTPSVRQRLNAGNNTWTACSNEPYFYLINDVARSSEYLIPKILTKIPVLLYNGNYDLICNMDGTATYLQNLNWPYQSQFNSAQYVAWNVPGNGAAGQYKTVSTLTELVVYNAGHMVPYDQPQNAYNMVFKFISGGFSS